MPVIKLQTMSMRSVVDTPHRPHKKRVFTDDEYNFLCSLPVSDLRVRIAGGRQVISLLARPDMLNMTPAQANAIASNLRYQIDEINKIIQQKRSLTNG
jgi:hypothetical protein